MIIDIRLTNGFPFQIQHVRRVQVNHAELTIHVVTSKGESIESYPLHEIHEVTITND